MATLTQSDVEKLKSLKAKGYSMDEAFAELAKSKESTDAAPKTSAKITGKDILKSKLSPITEGAGEVVTGAGKQLVKDTKSLLGILMTSVQPTLGQTFKQDVEKLIPNKKLEPTSDLQQAGATATQVAEYFIPAGASAKATKAISSSKFVKGLPTYLQGISKLGGAAATEAAAMGGVTAVQEGGLNKKVLSSAAMGGAIPIVGGAASKITSPISKIITQKIPSSILNSLIKPAKNEFKFSKNPGAAIAKEKISATTLGGLAKKVTSKKKELGQAISSNVTEEGSKVNAEKIINKIASNYTSKITDPNAAAKFKTIMDQIFKKTKYKDGELIVTGTRDLTSLSPKDLHKLQQQVGDLIPWVKESYDKDINQTLSKIYSALGKKLNNVAPGTKDLQTRYSNILAAEKSINSRLDKLASSNLMMNLSPMIGFGTGYAATPGDTVDKIFQGLMLSGVIKSAGSTAFKSNLARLLSSMKGGEKANIESLAKFFTALSLSDKQQK